MTLDPDINRTGQTVDASMKIQAIHKKLCEELIPHEIVFIDYGGIKEVYSLDHPTDIYDYWEEEGE